MSTKTVTDTKSAVIEHRDQLIAAFAKGEKPPERWRIGTEHEKFVYRLSDHRAPGYDEPGGIRDLLMALTEFGWTPVMEGDNVIALTGPDGSVSLEPAGQLELSGAPLDNLHETCAETGRHLEQVLKVGEKLGLGYLGLGLWPDKARADLPIMPKGRYAIMLCHMPRVGSMGLDMMLRTCTTQVNLDYSSEADMVQKFRVGLALQPTREKEVPRRPGAPAAGDRVVRQFAVPGRQAQRLPQLSQPYLVRHRSRAHRHASVRV